MARTTGGWAPTTTTGVPDANGRKAPRDPGNRPRPRLRHLAVRSVRLPTRAGGPERGRWQAAGAGSAVLDGAFEVDEEGAEDGPEERMMPQIHVSKGSDAVRPTTGTCESSWGSNSCPNAAEFILKVTTNNGFAIMCGPHKDGYIRGLHRQGHRGTAL